MGQKASFFAVAAAFLFFPGFVQAQHPIPVGGGRAPVSAPSPGRTSQPSAAVVHVQNPGHTTRTRNVAPPVAARPALVGDGSVFFDGTPFAIDPFLTPLSGFTFNGSPDIGVMAFIDPATQLRLATAERFLRAANFTGTFTPLYAGYGYPYPMETGEEQQPPAAEQSQQAPPQQQQQPQIIVLQQNPEAGRGPAQFGEPSAEANAGEVAPLPDEGQFTLILRNGQQLQAVAFTKSKDRIVYITPDGMRHTVPANDIDAAATKQINEERGTPLQLPL